MNQKEKAKIERAARLKWFRYYNVLRNNHIVNALIIMLLNRSSEEMFGVHQAELVVLMIIRFYGGSNVTLDEIRSIYIEIAGRNERTMQSYLIRLSYLGCITRKKVKGGRVSLTSKGNGIVHKFELYFTKMYQELRLKLPNMD